MTSNEEINRITKSLPPDLIPTLTYRPDIQSTVSIDTETKGFSEDSIQYSLPKLSIKKVDSKEKEIMTI